MLTIGYGHTRGVRLGQTITRGEAELLLSADLEPIERQLTADLGEDGVLQCQFDALCSFCFNLGIGAYMRSTLRKYVKAGRDADADREFGRWVHAGGRVLPGLVRRRGGAPLDPAVRLSKKGVPHRGRRCRYNGQEYQSVSAMARALGLTYSTACALCEETQ